MNTNRILVRQPDSVRCNPKPRNMWEWLVHRAWKRDWNQHLEIRLYDQFGVLKDFRDLYNTVTTAGKEGLADAILLSPTLGKPTHMAVGTGTPGANALGVENDRNALTSKTRSGAVVTCVGDWAAGDATAALTEAGWFNASSAGNMWVSAAFSVVNKGANDTLNIDWDLTVA